MTDSEQRHLASVVAQEVLEKFFLTIGVDISTPAGVIELQKDFHHIRNARETVDSVKIAVRSKVADVLTGSAVTAVLGAVGWFMTHHV